jgi:hypothetical protein
MKWVVEGACVQQSILFSETATLDFYFPSVDCESCSEASVHDEFVSTSALKIA